MKLNTTQATNPSNLNRAASPQQTRPIEQAAPCTPMSIKESSRLIAMIAANHVLEARGSKSGFEFADFDGPATQSANDISRLAASLPTNRCIEIQGKLVSSIDLLRTAERLSPQARFNCTKADGDSSGLSKPV